MENARGPELPHAASPPDGTLPTGSTLPRFQTFPGLPARHPLLEETNAQYTAGPGLTHGRGPQDGRLMWIRCRGLGKTVPGKLAFEGSLPLTAKSLSASTV